MLFLILIGACLSITQDSLQPFTSTMPSSLISVAKTNPQALVQMLDGADPDAINNIVKILQGLIQDGVGELSALRNDISNATKLRREATAEVDRLRGEEAVAGDNYRKLAGIEADKKGIYEASLAAYESSKPGLEKELSLLQKVTDMLEDLLVQNTPEEKDLIELGSSQKGKAYLKLIANVQANPEKLEKIIGFIGTLWSKTNTTLGDLKHKVDTSLDIYEAAQRAALVGKGKWAVAVTDLENGQKALAQAEGSLAGAVDALKKREPVIKSEENTLRQVIDLLKSTADKPQPTKLPEPRE